MLGDVQLVLACSLICAGDTSEEVLVVVVDVLLQLAREVGVTLAEEVLDHARRHRSSLASIAVCAEADGELGELDEEVLGGAGAGGLESARSHGEVSVGDLGEGKEDLKETVAVAGVAEVAESNVSGASDGRELETVLGDGAPLIAEIEVNLQLCHGLLGLLHLEHVDTPVGEVLGEKGICHVVVLVLGVTVDICTVRSDGAQLDNERVLLASLLEVLERCASTTGAVPVLPPASNMSSREVQPEVLSHPTLCTPPAARVGADLHTVVQLHQPSRVLALL
mmetsp:Transcript_13134/g.52396  ORF Transcript_13134/g.52396 Transcript_13134/m.52396 type:complete len:280 (-) Transcript_13134:554-1393(-)